MTYNYKKIKSQVFDCNIHVVVADDPSEYMIKKGIPVESLKNAEAITAWDLDDPTNYHVIFPNETSYETIAHESVHCINKVFLARDVRPDFNNDEIYAYHVGWLAGEIAHFISKLINKKQNNETTK